MLYLFGFDQDEDVTFLVGQPQWSSFPRFVLCGLYDNWIGGSASEVGRRKDSLS